MSGNLRLTDQEIKVVNYLSPLTEKEIPWDLLAQFSKNPNTVKYKSIQKVISEIKRKYRDAGLPIPFKVNIRHTTLDEKVAVVMAPSSVQSTVQNLVQVKKTPGGNIMIVGSTNTPQSSAQIDFALNVLTKSVRTKSGQYKLNDNEWYIFKYFHENSGRLINISELRDKVMFPNYGSKLPARWLDAIMRVINNLRRQVHGLDKRLLTVKSEETSYLFQ